MPRRDRIEALGATLLLPLESRPIETRIAEIARLWAELHEIDPDLALELARKLPTTQISIA